MANICHGHWRDSKINGNDDGTIDVEQGAAGVIGGKHNKSDKRILGVCIEDTDPPKMRFVRLEGTSVLIYDGEIEERTIPFPHFKIVNGTVTTVPPTRQRTEEVRTDDWTAEKPT